MTDGHLVGTSGWQYRDWRGVLYPEGVPQRLWLERYAETFSTVESNAAFYRLPTPGTFRSWYERTPENFVMAVKASRYLTHIRRLAEPAEPVARLLTAARELDGKLGPILVQLPPTLRLDLPLLAGCLRCFPPGIRVCVEFRHDSWWTPEVQELLGEHGVALCWSDRQGRRLAPLWRTADWVYLRCHEGDGAPWPDYRDRTLRGWAAELAGVTDAYVYFNNDQNGAAVRDARRMITFVRSRTV